MILKIASGRLFGHFLYRAADEVLKEFPDQSIYVAEAGFTPSGKIHLGNFNDLCITYALVKILEFWGYKGRAIVAIDSRDPFRQAPIFAPEEFKKKERELRGIPFDEIEDPWGCHKNFAEHFIEPVINSFSEYGLKIEAIRAHEIHTNPKYIELVKDLLVNREKVRRIFNKVREKAGHRKRYDENWIPYRPKCEHCGRMDENVKAIEVSEDGQFVKYKCGYCGFEGVADVTKAQGKPPFRIDWPIRWVLFNVHFEPMGKDLMASGSSFDTGRALLIEYYNRKPPISVFYDFFYWIPPEDLDRKVKLKFSKRKGVGFGVDEWLQYAPPEVLKYLIIRRQIADIHAESLKHVDFCPLDIPSYVDAYDKHEELFYNVIEGQTNRLAKPDIDRIIATYILSQVDLRSIPSKKPRRIPYGVAIEVALWMEDIDDGLMMLRRMGKLPKNATQLEIEDARKRLYYAKNWVKEYYRPSLPSVDDIKKQLDEKRLLALKAFIERALKIPRSEVDMNKLRPIVKEIANELGLKTKEIYEAIYLAALGKIEGPPVARLLKKDFMRRHLAMLVNEI